MKQLTPVICVFELPNRAVNLWIIKMRTLKANLDCFQYAIKSNVIVPYCSNTTHLVSLDHPKPFVPPLSICVQRNLILKFFTHFHVVLYEIYHDEPNLDS